MARQFYYNSAATEGSTTAAKSTPNSGRVQVALTFTPDANATYALLWRATIRSSQTTYVFFSWLEENNTLLDERMLGNKDTTNRQTAGGIYVFTAGGSPSSMTFNLRHGSFTSGTTYAADAHLVAIKLDAADKYAVQGDSAVNSTSSTYQDALSLNFTPATQGDYLILTTAQVNGTGTSGVAEYRVYDSTDTVVWDEVTNQWGTNAASSARYQYNSAFAANYAASSRTIKFQYNSNGSATTYVNFAAILALRLDKFNDPRTQRSATRVTTTSTSLQDGTSLTFTPTTDDWLVLASAHMDGSSTSWDSEIDFLKAGSTQLQAMQNQEVTENGDICPFFYFKVEALTASSTTWKFQYSAENGANTAGLANQFIAALNLDADPITIHTKTVAATAVGTSSITRKITFVKTVAAVVVAVAAMTRIKTFVRTIAATAIGVPTISRLITFYRTIAATAVGSPTLTELSTRYRTIAATAVGTATIASSKLKVVLVSATAAAAATMTRVSTRLRTIAATAVGSATLTKLSTRLRTIAATAVGSPVLTKLSTRYRTIAATAVGTATMTRLKTFLKTIAATANGVATMTRLKTFLKTIAATANGVASLVADFIAASGTTYYKTVAATAVASVAISRQITKLVLISAVVSGLAGLALAVTFRVAVSAVASGVSAIARSITRRVSIAATALAAATMSRVSTRYRTLAATAVGVATMSRAKTMYRVLAATAVAAATLVTDLVFGKTLVSTAVAVATLGTTYIAYVYFPRMRAWGTQFMATVGRLMS